MRQRSRRHPGTRQKVSPQLARLRNEGICSKAVLRAGGGLAPGDDERRAENARFGGTQAMPLCSRPLISVAGMRADNLASIKAQKAPRHLELCSVVHIESVYDKSIVLVVTIISGIPFPATFGSSTAGIVRFPAASWIANARRCAGANGCTRRLQTEQVTRRPARESGPSAPGFRHISHISSLLDPRLSGSTASAACATPNKGSGHLGGVAKVSSSSHR